MNQKVDSPRLLEERLMDGRIARKEDLPWPVIKKKMIGQRRTVMRRAECPDGTNAVETDRLIRPQDPEANPRFYLAAPQSEKVQQTPAEVDGRFRTHDQDFAGNEHLAMDQRGQAINMVWMNMRQNDRGDPAGIEPHLPDLGGDASGAVDEDESPPGLKKKGSIIPLRRGR